jgi:hypothetical protein
MKTVKARKTGYQMKKEGLVQRNVEVSLGTLGQECSRLIRKTVQERMRETVREILEIMRIFFFSKINIGHTSIRDVGDQI